MEIWGEFIIIMCVTCLHQTDSLVLTKYEPETITAYLKHISQFRNDLAVQSFIERHLNEFCLDLRAAYTYQSVTREVDEQPEPEWNDYQITHHISDHVVPNLGGVCVRKFRFGNTNQSLHFHSFQCSNFEGEPIWFITPDFIPHSTFLFKVQPKFRNLISREIKPHHEIPAQLIGIIDESITETRNPTVEDNMINRYIKASNYSGRDKLCDLNRFLQFRICVVALSPALHTPGSTNIYYAREGGCRPVQVVDGSHRNGIINSTFNQEMLHCSVHISDLGLMHYYLGLVEDDPIEIIFLHEIFDNITDWNDRMIVHKIPILKYIDTYLNISKDIDI